MAIKKYYFMASEKVQQVRVNPTKSDGLGLIPGTHII